MADDTDDIFRSLPDLVAGYLRLGGNLTFEEFVRGDALVNGHPLARLLVSLADQGMRSVRTLLWDAGVPDSIITPDGMAVGNRIDLHSLVVEVLEAVDEYWDDPVRGEDRTLRPRHETLDRNVFFAEGGRIRLDVMLELEIDGDGIRTVSGRVVKGRS